MDRAADSWQSGGGFSKSQRGPLYYVKNTFSGSSGGYTARRGGNRACLVHVTEGAAVQHHPAGGGSVWADC
jgi:hypothetical protein